MPHDATPLFSVPSQSHFRPSYCTPRNVASSIASSRSRWLWPYADDCDLNSLDSLLSPNSIAHSST
jgi:hypothetical protein